MIQSYDSSSGLAYYDATTTNIPNVNSLLGRAVRSNPLLLHFYFYFYVKCWFSIQVAIHSGRDHGAGQNCDQAGKLFPLFSDLSNLFY
jgi:hypothetical protein